MARFSSLSFSSLLCFFSLLPYYYYYVLAGPVADEFLYPNFTASYLDYVDNSGGVFLSSGGSAPIFTATFYSPGGQSSSYYLALLHFSSGAAVWIANPAAPVPSTAVFSLSPAGLSLARPDGSLAWSTPALPRPAAALHLLASGELRLLDAANGSLWSSFDHPTDTLLPGQLLPAAGATALTSGTSDSDPSPGDYRLVVTSGDAALEWAQSSQLYWTLSTDIRAVKDSNFQVAYLAINATGIYLLAGDQKTTVFAAVLPPPSSSDDFRFAKLDPSGRLRILTYSPNDSSSSSSLNTDFVAPANDCDRPLACGSLGLCAAGANGSTCSCPTMFGPSSTGDCTPANGDILANSSCPSAAGPSPASYVSLGSKVGYFGNKFAVPTTSGDDLLACRSICSGNCSCLGFFYRNSSKSCYLLQHQIGSLFSSDSSTADTGGYIKVLSSSPQANQSSSSTSSADLVVIFVPTVASILLVLALSFIGFRLWWRKRSKDGDLKTNKIGSNNQGKYGWHKPWPSPSEFSVEECEMEDDDISIPGLPTRFTYADLEAATDNFETKIGSGGFGSVYKGHLPDMTLVAVKKINNVSVQGKREFCTEIAVIGNIHHVNLVKLRGFCAQGSKRLLVYEYMNRGSLDSSLFGPGPTLEWQERVNIAAGAARGLAYLHSGCEQKIIHCDVKPENILLHDHNQVKMGDFGLAKLLSPDQSGLFTTMRGTRGYLAPEWLTNSAISDKTDVYSFGMVLLEIVRGRRNRSEDGEQVWTGFSTSSGSSGPAAYFPTVALEMHEIGRYEELADPRLEGRVTGPEIGKMVKVALCCLHEEPMLRPSMASVAGMLEGTMSVPEPRVESLNFLKYYGRGFSHTKAKEILSSGFMDSGSGSSRISAGGTSSSPLPSYLTSSQQLSGPR